MKWPCQHIDDYEAGREEIWLALQISEDTCAEHNKFLCPDCFDFTAIDEK